MKKYSKEIGVVGVALVVGLAVVGLSSYRSTLDKKASNELALLNTQNTTQVLGVVDIPATNKFFVSGAVTEQKGSESIVTVVVRNDTTEHYEFSPGLQLFAVLADGSEIAISGLGGLNPLEGGPMDPDQKLLGSVKYPVESSQIKSIRLYTTAEKTSYTDTDAKVMQ
jgi:hypothetical protein